MRVLLLESFYGGSHRDVADNLVSHSRHDVTVASMPARFWKWRMRSAALEFARRVPDPTGFDLVVSSGLITLADLRAAWGAAAPPILLYAHETQLSYPAPEDEQIDAHFGMTDLTNMIAADHIAFNSHSHRSRFLNEISPFLRRLPDFRPTWIAGEVERKSSVCYPGISIRGLDPDDPHDSAPKHPPVAAAASGTRPAPDSAAGPRSRTAPGSAADLAAGPLVIWNHRWEFDKNPAAFFDALATVADQGVSFRLAVLGENFQMKPKEFLKARERFSDRIVAWGYEPSKAVYLELLAAGDLVISTSIQENFGISTLEAIAAGCFPLLPRRLSYPEIIPEAYHDRCLYDSQDQLVSMLRSHLLRETVTAPELTTHARGFAWQNRIGEFDSLFERVAHQ
jgi:glycosyltransferase involved in cell wall biosynthesis